MYHVAEMVRDAQRDMQERSEGGGYGYGYAGWIAYTPLPFLYALTAQIVCTMQRKAPDLVKRAAVGARDHLADAVTATHTRVVGLRLSATRAGQVAFYRVKVVAETAPLPAPIAPVRSHVVVPVLHAVEGVAHFVASDELPELYFVAKNAMRRRFLLRHLVLPPLGAVESVARYMVILPTQLVFPSREEIELRTDLLLDVSTSRVQAIVDNIYSATEVLDERWSMVQWNILGRGPYERLSRRRRAEVVHSVDQRRRTLASYYKLYEFMASIKLQNEMLYFDLLQTFPDSAGVPVDRDEEVKKNAALAMALEEQEATAFPIWFYRKLDVTSGNGQLVPSGTNGHGLGSNAANPMAPAGGNGNGHGAAANGSSIRGGWIEFPAHETRRLERKYRWYQQQKARWIKQHGSLANGGPLAPPSSIVLVDEGRHEVCLETMAMKPVYWPELEQIEVYRAVWLYAQRNYGLAPYTPEAASALEDAFTYYLAYYPKEQQRVYEVESKKPRNRGWFGGARPIPQADIDKQCTLSVPIDGDLVEFKGPHDMVQYTRLLAGTTPFTSKRRVYRGDPRIRHDAATLQHWQESMQCTEDGSSVVAAESGNDNHDDDADIKQDVDHLVLIVHGIGDALKTIDLINVVTLRSIIDCATNLRTLHREARTSTHFSSLNQEQHVEFLPIEWHSKLHMEDLDGMIRDVTLPAIPKLRELANDTVLDVLLFMSPIFHEVILNEVANEMNRVVELFRARHSSWQDGRKKKVSVVAHSLGSIIAFDILNHQSVFQDKNGEMPTPDGSNGNVDTDDESSVGVEEEETAGTEAEAQRKVSPHLPRRGSANHMSGKRRKRRDASRPRTLVYVPRLEFDVENLFCFGSPVGLFLNVRGQKIDRSFSLPMCKRLFNIYHPYDPVAYRIEPIVNPVRANSKAAIIRTFEGKLRFQYQLRNSFRTMWQTLRQWRRDFEFDVAHAAHSIGLVEEHAVFQPGTRSSALLSPLADVLALTSEARSQSVAAAKQRRRSRSSPRRVTGAADDETRDVDVYGRLCQGLPVDYSLQENEIEIANEYLFALTAHVIYWGNRDASLFMAQKLVVDPADDEELAEDMFAAEEETIGELEELEREQHEEAIAIVEQEAVFHGEGGEVATHQPSTEKEEATASSELSLSSGDELEEKQSVPSMRRRRQQARRLSAEEQA